MTNITYSRFLDRTCKFCILVAVTLVVPALAFADRDNHTSNYGENRWRDYHHEDNDRDNDHRPPIVSTPEANTGMVLIPFVGAVLLFSSLQLLRAKAPQKNGARP